MGEQVSLASDLYLAVLCKAHQVKAPAQGQRLGDDAGRLVVEYDRWHSKAAGHGAIDKADPAALGSRTRVERVLGGEFFKGSTGCELALNRLSFGFGLHQNGRQETLAPEVVFGEKAVDVRVRNVRLGMQVALAVQVRQIGAPLE